MKKLAKILLFLCLPQAPFISCVADCDEPTIQFDEATFLAERTAWEAQKCTDYSFAMAYKPGYRPATYNAVVTVTDGNGTVVTEGECHDTLPSSVDAVYAKVYRSYTERKTALDAGNAHFDEIVYKITYDATYHYPASVIIDERSSDDGDGSWSVTVSKFALAD